MLTLYKIAIEPSAQSRYLYFIFIMLMMILISCGTDQKLQRTAFMADESTASIKYSIIFFIHGDGDYNYHDTDGKKNSADEVALAKIQKIAVQNPNAEIFVFHQKPREHFLFFFPLKDGEFFYYRNGQLIHNEMYWRDYEKSNFDNEIDYYRLFHVKNRDHIMNLVFYFGHEISEIGGAGYDVSYAERTFTINDFAEGLSNFKKDFEKFDLIILSTCYGGTPFTISTIAPLTKYIIASPENLHLSYFDLNVMERLDNNLHKENIYAFAKSFAKLAFDRLTKDIHTAVSVAVYDAERVKEYINSVERLYKNTLTTKRGETATHPQNIERCDCAEIPEYKLSNMNEGVEIFYRPAKFGKLKNKKDHSGWQCWKLIE